LPLPGVANRRWRSQKRSSALESIQSIELEYPEIQDTRGNFSSNQVAFYSSRGNVGIGTEGDFGALARHAPMITTVRAPAARAASAANSPMGPGPSTTTKSPASILARSTTSCTTLAVGSTNAARS